MEQDLLASMTIDHDFPGKVSHCNSFLSRCCIKEKDIKRGKEAKGKRTTHGKTNKASKCTDKHDNESNYRPLK